jgi:Na+-transporting NADH:ubiquinone oxidoreductase subunit NqrB
MALLVIRADARYFQMLFQYIFLLYGICFLHWQAEWLSYLLYIATALFIQWMADAVIQKKLIPMRQWWHNGVWKSTLISALSLCLLLKTNSCLLCIVAAAISVLGKYIFRFGGRHIFNPSALAIAVVVYGTGNAWVSPGQWGNTTILFFGIATLGTIVVTRVQKLDASLAFLGTFAMLLFARQVLYLGWPADYFIQSVSTGSLLLFSFFMITDPKTTPNHPLARTGWAMLVAALAFYLATFKFINAAPVWALVCLQPVVPLLNYLFKAKNFEWQKPSLLHRINISHQ